MKKIKLTKGYEAIVDDKDFDFLNQWKWYFAHGYAVRTQNNYPNKPFQVRMHRIILGTPEGMDSDHINRDRLDNRRSNLRICNRSQNISNTFLRSNKSGYKGVEWHKASQKWQARIRFYGKRLQLGVFKTALSAHRAYNKAARKYHGKFARLK